MTGPLQGQGLRRLQYRPNSTSTTRRLSRHRYSQKLTLRPGCRDRPACRPRAGRKIPPIEWSHFLNRPFGVTKNARVKNFSPLRGFICAVEFGNEDALCEIVERAALVRPGSNAGAHK